MAASRKVPQEEFVPDQMTEAKVDRASGQEIAVQDPFTREQYSGIESLQDAITAAADAFGGVVVAHDDPLLGSGFKIATEDDKIRLMGVQLLLLDWRFNPGEYGKEFVSIHAVTGSSTGKADKWILNDGGTGICRDLREYSDKTNRYGGLYLEKGLRISRYPTDPETGVPLSKTEHVEYLKQGRTVGKGHTFYLDFSA